MFVRRSLFEYWREEHDREMKFLNERYWKLRHAHERLLAHLGLIEVDVAAKTILEKKGGPEHD